MPEFNSGRKVINKRIDSLVRELDSLKKAVPAYSAVQNYSYGGCLEALNNSCANGNSLQPIFVKDNGSHIARPLSFEESVDAIVDAYESGNRELLYNWNDTCTGIAYKTGTQKFKVVPVSKELILLSGNFSQPSILVDYDSMEGIELDRSKGKYKSFLTKAEALSNPALCSAVPDKILLSTFWDIVSAERKTDSALGFYPSKDPFFKARNGEQKNEEQDYLRPLSVNYLSYSSIAFDRDSLINYNSARFIVVTKRQEGQ